MGMVIQFPGASTKLVENDAHSSPRPSPSREFIHQFFLPMINMNSGVIACIYATLNYVHGLATRYHVRTVTMFLVLEGIGDCAWVTSGSPTEGHNHAVG